MLGTPRGLLLPLTRLAAWTWLTGRQHHDWAALKVLLLDALWFVFLFVYIQIVFMFRVVFKVVSIVLVVDENKHKVPGACDTLCKACLAVGGRSCHRLHTTHVLAPHG